MHYICTMYVHIQCMPIRVPGPVNIVSPLLQQYLPGWVSHHCLHLKGLRVGHQESGPIPPPLSPAWWYILGAHDTFIITHTVAIYTWVWNNDQILIGTYFVKVPGWISHCLHLKALSVGHQESGPLPPPLSPTEIRTGSSWHTYNYSYCSHR